MAWLGYVATGLQVAGSLMSARGAGAVGRAEQEGKEYEATQLEELAGQELASSQRGAQEQRRRSKIIASRALALAAAGGGGASDQTVSKILADIEVEGAYRASLELYRGEEEARRLRMGAGARRYEGGVARASGEAKSRAYKLKAVGGLAGMGSSLYKKYGMKKPGLAGGTKI